MGKSKVGSESPLVQSAYYVDQVKVSKSLKHLGLHDQLTCTPLLSKSRFDSSESSLRDGYNTAKEDGQSNSTK